MREIEILSELPIILTKDNNWQLNTVMQPGAIIYLPEDAIVIALPQIDHIEIGSPNAKD